MLSGSSTQSPPQFPLAIVRRILDIAPHFIDMQRREIFIYTGTSAVNALLAILQEEILSQSDEPTTRIQLAIKKHRSEMEEAKERKIILSETIESIRAKKTVDKEILRQHEKEFEEVDAKCYPIDDYDWAVACKLAMSNGNILHDTPETRRVIEIFLEQLKQLHRLYNTEEFKQCMSFARIDASDTIIQLIGQLCALEHFESAYVIHQFLNLSHLALSERVVNQVDENGLATVLTPGILQGLGLYRRIIPRTGNEAKDTAADAQEFTLFKKILPSFLKSPIFQQSFNPELYKGIVQPFFVPTRTVQTNSSSPILPTIPPLAIPSSSSSYDLKGESQLLKKWKLLSIATREKKQPKYTRKTSEPVPPLRSTIEPGSPRKELLPAYSLLHSVPPPLVPLTTSSSAEDDAKPTTPRLGNILSSNT
ncbi:hypothetical protein [Candidatus Berkiella aquae]|uniref:Uncharacterized protein n=1 Tax=Candidatus Berkiella aquae TaxID=295108 RepID=A0A0Q9YYE9_9GAMM|nr:hypothetical protein [Candidatus Berkiella aquae]MCS5712065.1 hypothetical protein [Candidatus Berkiella aquae]